MKKIISVFLVLTVMLITGCGNNTTDSLNKNVVEDKFLIHSLSWGDTWENIEKEGTLKHEKTIRDDGNMYAAQFGDTEFLGVTGKTILMFDVAETSFPSVGLQSAYFVYDEKDEDRIIEESEKLYGERKEYFLDKDGIENPLNPPAWYSKETVEGSLSNEEKEKYLEYLQDAEKTRIDALMRSPLVIITLDEEENMIRFQASDAAVVKNIKDMR